MTETLTHTRAADLAASSRVTVRQATPDDIPALVRLEETVWQDRGASAEQWVERLRIFPEGVIVATDDSDRLWGVVSIHIVGYDLHLPMATWYEATADGFVDNHDPAGNMAYGDTLTVHRHAPRDASTSLLVAAGRVVVRRRLDGIIVGSRMPGYKRYAGVIPATEYARLSFNGESKYLDSAGVERKFKRDPELHLYRKHSLKLVTVLPDYFDDPDSGNWGAILVWKNYFRRLPLPGLWARLLTVRTAQGWRGFIPHK